MQFKVLALPLALAATTLVSAAPISVSTAQVHIAVQHDLYLHPLKLTDFPLQCLTNIPQQQGHIVAREPLNAAGMIGLTIGSVFKGMFGSKEAADEFLSTEEGQAFVSKLASDLEAEDETVSVLPEWTVPDVPTDHFSLLSTIFLAGSGQERAIVLRSSSER